MYLKSLISTQPLHMNTSAQKLNQFDEVLFALRRYSKLLLLAKV